MVLSPVSWTESAETHIARHQVAPHEVEEVLYGRPRYLAPGRSGTRPVFARYRRRPASVGRHRRRARWWGEHRDRAGDDRHREHAFAQEGQLNKMTMTSDDHDQ